MRSPSRTEFPDRPPLPTTAPDEGGVVGTGPHHDRSGALLAELADGADLRTIVLDDTGNALGVGRRTRVPRGWLRDVVMVRDLNDRSPGGRTPVHRCDLDHLVGWDDDGPTDADNLQPVGRRTHTGKTRGDWTVTRTRDGTTTWHHPTTGVTVRRPPTWRRLDRPPDTPPGDPPDR